MKIDKNIPIPADFGNKKTKYRFQELEVNDSTFFLAKRMTVLASLSRFKDKEKYKDWDFVTEERTEKVEGVDKLGVRVWRIK